MAQPARDPAFRKYLTVQQQYDNELASVLEAAARDIEAQIRKLKIEKGIGSKVREAQLRITLDAIHKEMASVWSPGVSGVVLRGSKAAAKASEIAVETVSRVVYASLPGDTSAAIVRAVQAAGRSGIDALYARVPRELSARIYKDRALANGTIDRLIQQGLAQRLSARELAQTIYQYVSPTAPGGASYSAMRLARTEINNAFHNAQIAVGKTMPGVTGVKWNLSGSHPKPDVCNQYAEEDHDNLGSGVYKPENVPPKPHPHCFCFLTYVTLSTKEFKRQLEAGSFDDELRRRLQLNLDRLKGAA